MSLPSFSTQSPTWCSQARQDSHQFGHVNPPGPMIGIAAFGFGPLSVKSLGAEENGGRNGGRDWKHIIYEIMWT